MRVVRIRWARVVGLGLAVACVALALKVESQGRALREARADFANVLRERLLADLAGKGGGLAAELADCSAVVDPDEARRELATARAEIDAWRGLVSRHLCEDAQPGWRWEITDYELSSSGIEMSYRSVAEPTAGGLGLAPPCRPCADAASRALFGRDPVAEQARWASPDRATHEVADLLEPRGAVSAEALLSVVAAQAGAGGWRPPAALELHGTQLVVFHDADVRARIERLLVALRPAPPETPEEAGRRAFAAALAAFEQGRFDEAEARFHALLATKPDAAQAISYRDEAGYRFWVKVLARGGRLAQVAKRLLRTAEPQDPALPIEIHDVQDLVASVGEGHGCEPLPPAGAGHIGPDALLDLVRGLTGGPAAWAEPASLEAHRGQLIVARDAAGQARVREVLRALRAARVEEAARHPDGLLLEFVDVSDLVGTHGVRAHGAEGPVPPPALVDVIRGAVGPAAWVDGSLEVSMGILIIRAERPVHARIVALLRALRASGGWRAVQAGDELSSGTDGGVIEVEDPIVALFDGHVLELYDVADVLAGPPLPDGPVTPERLTALLRASTGGDAAWALPARLELRRDRLVVVHGLEVHEKIVKLLDALRRPR